MTVEHTILSHLVFNEEYSRKVLPFIKPEYFLEDSGELKTFSLIAQYIEKYNKIPSVNALVVDLQKEINSLNEHSYTSAITTINSLEESKADLQWLVDTTEKFCQEKAIYNGIMKSLEIMDDKSGKTSTGMIPQLLSDALAVSFDNHIGHDFTNDSDERFEYYHQTHTHIPFDIDYLNKITKGGIIRKTLNVFMAGTNVGKTLAMCHFAATNLMYGYNVLYITMEMAEEKIAERIDANLLDVELDDIPSLPKSSFDKKIDKIKQKTQGRLIIKEYPNSCAGASHFRHLLNELRIKKDFVPAIIYIDYLNICMSSRLRLGSAVNSYTYIKAIAEELRALAVEHNLPIITATQTNREGSVDSDFDMTATSESFGLPMTADLLIGMMSSEEMDELGQFQFKVLKNRYGDATKDRRFVVGVDRAKMRLYNVEESAQTLMDDDTPVMEKTSFNKEAFQDFK